MRTIPDNMAFEVMATFKEGKLRALYAKATDDVGMRPFFVDLVPMLRELIQQGDRTDSGPDSTVA